MKKGESGNNSSVTSYMISLGPQSASGSDHQTVYKGKARLDKNLDARSNCVVMPIADGRLNSGLIPMYPLNFMPNFLQACKMGPPYPFPATPGGNIMSASPSMVNMASFTLMRELEAQAGKLKDNDKISPTSATVRNTLGLAPTVVSHQIEMTNINLGRTNSTNPTTLLQPQLHIDEETDSSSTHSDQSSDSDFEDEERVLVRNWEKDRCNVAWKWSWLQLQVDYLKNQLKESDQQSEKILNKKQKLIPDFKKEDGDEQCSRTTGFAPPKERKKLIVQQSSGPTVLNKVTHPVLKVKAPKRKHSMAYEEEDYKPSFSLNTRNGESTPKKKARNPTPLRLHTPVTPPTRIARSYSSPRLGHSSPRLGPSSSRFSSPSLGSPKLGLLSSSTDSFSPRTRRQRKRDEFCVDNVVIPFSGAHVSPRIHKDIFTPSWTVVGDTEIDMDAALERATREEQEKGRNSNKRSKLEISSESLDKTFEDSVPVTTTIQVEENPTDPGTGELLESCQKEQKPESPSIEMPSLEISIGETLPFVVTELPIGEKLEDGESKDICEQPRDSNEPKDDTKDLNSNGGNPNVRLLVESKEVEVESMSSDEDTSDESFAQRHFCRELLERKRYLFPDKNKNLPATPEQLPAEFFVASLASPSKYRKKKGVNPKEEMEKLKQKFDKIRSRYVDSSKLHQSWEDLSYLAAREYYDDVEEMDEELEYVGEWDSGDDFQEEEELYEELEQWEIVQKPPQFDEQGRERNLIYMRRIQTPVAVVE